jgi:hypothetical protein
MGCPAILGLRTIDLPKRVVKMYYRSSKIKTAEIREGELGLTRRCPGLVLQNFNIPERPFALRSITYAASYT